MHFGGLDLNLLMVLDALFVEKNVTRAGERIHLSQSATSGALSRLREYFKDDLLVHVGRRMVLTPLAEELAQPVRELLQQTEALRVRILRVQHRSGNALLHRHVTLILTTTVEATGTSTRIVHPIATLALDLAKWNGRKTATQLVPTAPLTRAILYGLLAAAQFALSIVFSRSGVKASVLYYAAAAHSRKHVQPLHTPTVRAWTVNHRVELSTAIPNPVRSTVYNRNGLLRESVLSRAEEER